MDEGAHKRRLVEAIKAAGGMARRIEDRYAVGLLDLVFKLPGLPMTWAEGKIVYGNLFGPTPAQFVEGEKWLKVGVPVVLIGWKNSLMYLSPWVKQADIRTCHFLRNAGEVITLREFLTWGNQQEKENA